MIRMPSVRSNPSKLALNFVPRSRMRNFTARERSAGTKLGLRACWVTHAQDGFAVTPERCTCRVSMSIKNST
jgi:hypothetical protein